MPHEAASWKIDLGTHRTGRRQQPEEPVDMVEPDRPPPDALEHVLRDPSGEGDVFARQRLSVHIGAPVSVLDESSDSIVRDAVHPIGVRTSDRCLAREHLVDGRREVLGQEWEKRVSHPIARHLEVMVRLVLPVRQTPVAQKVT